jgi:hypothetical protein
MSTQSHTPENFIRPALFKLGTVVLLPVIGLIAIDLLIVHPLARDNLVSAGLAITLIVIPKLVLLPWIVIKTLQYTEDHYKRFGIATVKTSILACLCLAVLVISVSAIDAIQAIIFSRNAQAKAAQTSTPDYRLSADPANREYVIEGVIDFGITRDFRALLEQYPEGSRVVLTSEGGSIYEARGLAVLIQQHKLDTHVSDECSSACTLAFIGGQRRTLDASAKLGFHQYSMAYLNRHQVSPFHDLAGEQERDIEFMLARGISREFVDRAFEKSHQEIWFPDQASLIRFGVVHSIN